MKAALIVLASILAAVLASPAAARVTSTPGMRLAWNDCRGSTASSPNLSFACNDNLAGPFVLVGSFVPPNPPDSIQKWTGMEATLDLVSNSATLPDWWHFESGGCRDGHLAVTPTSGGLTGCVDALGDQFGGGFLYVPNYPIAPYAPLPNSAELRAVFAQPFAYVGPLTSGREYYAFRVLIDASATLAGPGGTPSACAGCGTQVCIVWNRLLLTQPAGFGDVTYTASGVPGDQSVTWQGTGANCSLVPVRRTSWGQLKGLYR